MTSYSNNDWLTKDRSETAQNRMPNRKIQNVEVLNPALGINVYRNVLSDGQCKKFIETLESNLNGQTRWSWNSAQVTSASEAILEARNAKDFKFNSTGLGPRTQENSSLYDMHEELFRSVKFCVDDYGRYWGVGMMSYEAFNFVKYEGAGTHFKIHADHGPTYVTTVSVVVYLNDDYVGGELWFPRFDLTWKPKTGDIAVFPSTYIYEHASQDMVEGTKYSVVIMTDYNDRDNVNQKVPQTIQNYQLKY